MGGLFLHEKKTNKKYLCLLSTGILWKFAKFCWHLYLCASIPDSGQQARLPAKHDPDVAAGQKRLSVPEMGEYSENESDELSQFLRLVWCKLVSDVL